MSLPTLTSTAATWTKIPAANALGPDLYHASVISSIGTTVLLATAGGVPVIGSAPNVATVIWQALPSVTGGPSLWWAPISDTPHAVYLLPDGRLAYE
jgi:hypothetical protein